MSCPRAHLHFSPLPHAAVNRHPHVLLVGNQQPNLLKNLEGWPKHWPASRNFLIRFVAPLAQQLAAIPSDSYDLAVVGRESTVVDAELIGQLVRVARQGVINLR
ncbi:class I SAM-dependent methyltransferase [Pseudomonas sp. zbq_18]|uniref:class I SAM-dependent methyltransferase n=1 Tax=Pseudomonas sp. zbq_18 TaxID=3367251 RepID=UPI003709EB22